MNRRAGLPDRCPGCGASRTDRPQDFEEGQTLCIGCGDRLHEQETTMDREIAEGRFSSRYHVASRLLSSELGWEQHRHRCPECGTSWACPQSGCRPGPRECPECENLIAAESVSPPEGYIDKPLTESDLAHRDLSPSR